MYFSRKLYKLLGLFYLPSPSIFMNLISSHNLTEYYLISLRSRYLMQFPSTLISPWCISTIRNRARNRLDFPDPVLPTMPTFSLGWVQNVTPHRASDRSLLYLRYTFLKETTPMVGQNGETYNNEKHAHNYHLFRVGVNNRS